MSIFSSLTRGQKEAIGLLQIGTFLEYFDLMLYVHMAVLLNELFFPKTDPHTAALLTAFAFCSTYVLRPFGALIFGWIGDNIGRKATVVFTTLMMSISCIIMANLPTYAEIGIMAAWIVTICRIIQGVSSMNEIIGAQIYVTELIPPPKQYPAVSFISFSSALGSVAALGVASLVTISGVNWRVAFWIGAGIAVVGSVARTQLRETPDFIDAKRKKLKEIEEMDVDEKSKFYRRVLVHKIFKKEKINIKTSFAYFLLHCGWPLCFYLSFMYFNPTLKEKFGYSSYDVIHHNFFLSLISLLIMGILPFLSIKINPLSILKLRGRLFLLTSLLLPVLITNANSSYAIFCIQAALIIFALAPSPADSILIKHFPTLKRFTATSLLYALKSTVMYILTSFSIVYLSYYFKEWGLLIIILPTVIGFLWSVDYFEKLEKSTPPPQPSN